MVRAITGTVTSLEPPDALYPIAIEVPQIGRRGRGARRGGLSQVALERAASGEALRYLSLGEAIEIMGLQIAPINAEAIRRLGLEEPGPGD